MRFKDFGSYLIVPAAAEAPERYRQEARRLEWIFIAVRWLWVPIIFLMAWLHHPAQADLMMVLGGALGLANIVACLLNIKIRTPRAQGVLGTAMLIIDASLAWGVILIFVRDFSTAAYAGFVYIVLEAAIRFGLAGSLSLAMVFALGLLGAFFYREAAFGVRFSVSGYVFWAVLMAIVAVAVGMIVNEGKRQRARSERQLRENTLLSERHRLARELHDTVLKTLQGLSLEARALGNQAADTPSVKETAKYIEEVCTRTSREIREVIFDLRREDITASIGSIIAKELDEWRQATGIPGELTISGQDRVLPLETTRQVRNIVSEALTNIQRHALAEHVRVMVKIAAGEVDIAISDDGHGLGRRPEDLSQFVSEGKLGIAGMKERTEALGGSFSLSSDPAGTTVGFRIPVAEYHSEQNNDR